MYLSLNWLKDFVDIPKSVTPEQIGDMLTMKTVEVEGIEDQKQGFNNVVVGKVLEVEKHPNADKLNLAKVDVGKKKLDIVCGAPNLAKNQLVPVALVGAILPGDFEIKETEIRGEKSFGMICAEDELGLGNDHDGIMVLEKSAKVGQDFADYLKLDDIILEVDNKSLSNRPDLWGHIGIARELSVFFDTKFKYTPSKEIEVLKETKGEEIKVKINDYKLCPRYMAMAVTGIEITESPDWMQRRLLAVGIRPINNIVDITNYVMTELGQPMHAFDYDKVNEIVVRKAKKGEVIRTLDSEERKLEDSMLVIADKNNPIAVAGVMGGLNSEITENTEKIIFESANFDPVSIRKTAGKLNLRTDASSRYEKSLDPNLCEAGMFRALELIKELCPEAKVFTKLVDNKKFELDQGPIKLNLEWVNKIIGKGIEAREIIKTLTKLGFEINEAESDEENLSITIPTWRATKDVSIPEDLVEEVLRVHGYDNVDPQLPAIEMEEPRINEMRMFEREVKEVFSKSARLAEVYNYSFVGEDQLKKLNIDYSKYIRLANPISQNHTMLRQDLATNLLSNIKLNQAKYNKIGIFELGNVYFDVDGDVKKDATSKEALPLQEEILGVMLAGNKQMFDEIKNTLLILFDYLGLSLSFEEADIHGKWATGNNIVGKVLSEGIDLGTVVEFDDKTLKANGVKMKVAVAELNMRKLFELKKAIGGKKYKEMPKYPSAVRDLAFVIDSKILYNNIEKEIRKHSDLIEDVELFDIYEGDKLGKGKKSMAFHITYRYPQGTLKNEEVDKIQKELIKGLEKRFSAQVRDF